MSRRTRASIAFVLAIAQAHCSPPRGFQDTGPDVTMDAAGDSPYVDPCLDAAPSAACPLCQPGVGSCTADGTTVRTCNGDGLGFTPGVRCDTANGELCTAGQCVVPCVEAARTHGYQGCEFFAVGTLNSGLGHYFPESTRDQFHFAVGVTNPWPVPVRLTLEGGGLTGTMVRTVAPNGTEVIDLPWVLAIAEGGDRNAIVSTRVPTGAVRITASESVGVYQFNPRGFVSSADCEGPQCYSYSNDASLLLPTTALRRQYMVVTRPTVRVRGRGDTEWRVSPGFIAMVGTSDAPTDVTVRLRGRSIAGTGIPAAAPGETIRQQLARGEVLQLLSDNTRACANPEPDTVRGDVYCLPVAAEDLTGTLIDSSAPIAVFAGHDCALVPHDRYACDHLEEQLFPTESLGRRYVIARTPPVASEPDLVRIVATRDATQLSFEPPRIHDPVTIAHAGEFIEFEQREAFEVQASEAVLVAQFIVGAHYDRDNENTPNGDPDMVLGVPVDQFRSAYEFVAAEGFTTSTAIAVVPRGERLVLDDTVVRALPVASAADYDVHYLRVLRGAHRIAAQRSGIRFGLTVSGLEAFTSYTYPGGLDLVAISPPL